MAAKDAGLLAVETIVQTLKAQYDSRESKEWQTNQELAWVRNQPSARIGKVGRLIFASLSDSYGLPQNGRAIPWWWEERRFKVDSRQGGQAGALNSSNSDMKITRQYFV